MPSLFERSTRQSQQEQAKKERYDRLNGPLVRPASPLGSQAGSAFGRALEGLGGYVDPEIERASKVAGIQERVKAMGLVYGTPEYYRFIAREMSEVDPDKAMDVAALAIEAARTEAIIENTKAMAKKTSEETVGLGIENKHLETGLLSKYRNIDAQTDSLIAGIDKMRHEMGMSEKEFNFKTNEFLHRQNMDYLHYNVEKDLASSSIATAAAGVVLARDQYNGNRSDAAAEEKYKKSLVEFHNRQLDFEIGKFGKTWANEDNLTRAQAGYYDSMGRKLEAEIKTKNMVKNPMGMMKLSVDLFANIMLSDKTLEDELDLSDDQNRARDLATQMALKYVEMINDGKPFQEAFRAAYGAVRQSALKGDMDFTKEENSEDLSKLSPEELLKRLNQLKTQ